MPTCREVSRAVASGDLERIGPRRGLAVRLHLLLCRHCRRYAAQLDAMARAARARCAETPDGTPHARALREAVLRDLPVVDGEDPGAKPRPGPPS